MKLASRTDEKESFELVLNKYRPRMTKKSKRAANLPTGPCRWDMHSKDWEGILEGREAGRGSVSGNGRGRSGRGRGRPRGVGRGSRGAVPTM